MEIYIYIHTHTLKEVEHDPLKMIALMKMGDIHFRLCFCIHRKRQHTSHSFRAKDCQKRSHGSNIRHETIPTGVSVGSKLTPVSNLFTIFHKISLSAIHVSIKIQKLNCALNVHVSLSEVSTLT